MTSHTNPEATLTPPAGDNNSLPHLLQSVPPAERVDVGTLSPTIGQVTTVAPPDTDDVGILPEPPAERVDMEARFPAFGQEVAETDCAASAAMFIRSKSCSLVAIGVKTGVSQQVVAAQLLPSLEQDRTGPNSVPLTPWGTVKARALANSAPGETAYPEKGTPLVRRTQPLATECYVATRHVAAVGAADRTAVVAEKFAVENSAGELNPHGAAAAKIDRLALS
ncbi:hypothetical protein CYMTET_31746 [Cymbomonas tetramitiformis]|uniref:Uncharacterized protein n=1 Tax=Cymbomonas tetramitiformis TaxID=36881 RepID=A0AAE0KSN2_9CHLO|nr:hypothetical protein CYMTET_31746 [Cymbomonas tetramitiformis]